MPNKSYHILNNTLYKYIFLFTVFFVLLTDSMPILGRGPYWFSIAFMAFCLFYNIITHRKINRIFFLWVISFCSFFLISGFWALSLKLVAFVLIVRLLPIIIITFSISTYIKSFADVYDILKVFYIVALLVLIYLLLFVNLSSLDARLSYDELGSNWNTNSIGVQFIFAIYCGFILFWKKNRCLKTIYVIISLLMLLVTIITGSRKGIILFFIPIVYMLVFNKGLKIYLKITLAVVGILFSYIIFSIPLFYNIAGSRIVEMINILEGSTISGVDNSRFFLILYGWEWFKESIWVGYGINNFRALSDATFMFAGKNFYAHCNYIELLVGVGIIGTIIYYSGYLYVMIKAYGQRSMSSKWVTVLFICLLFLDIAQVTYYGLIYLLFISIGFSTLTLQSQTKD